MNNITSIILMIGCIFSAWYSIGHGFFYLFNIKQEEETHAPKFLKYIGIIGGFITFFSAVYFMMYKEPVKEKPKYEKITEIFYRKVK
jgi:lipid-A-disaccharide synthase-like uncharacterized protein